MNELELSLHTVLVPVSLLVLYLVIFWIAKWVVNKLTPYDINAEISDKHNKAISIAFDVHRVLNQIAITTLPFRGEHVSKPHCRILQRRLCVSRGKGKEGRQDSHRQRDIHE